MSISYCLLKVIEYMFDTICMRMSGALCKSSSLMYSICNVRSDVAGKIHKHSNELSHTARVHQMVHDVYLCEEILLLLL